MSLSSMFSDLVYISACASVQYGRSQKLFFNLNPRIYKSLMWLLSDCLDMQANLNCHWPHTIYQVTLLYSVIIDWTLTFLFYTIVCFGFFSLKILFSNHIILCFYVPCCRLMTHLCFSCKFWSIIRELNYKVLRSLKKL